MEELISVIVPIYKVEAYLRRCVLSITSQTYKNLEIILVDDGSPDRCGVICDELKKWDSRIKVIHKKNGGLSDARNAGIAIAKGRYYVFVDSDDYLAPFFVEALYRALLKWDADVAFCSYQVVEGENPISFEKEFLSYKQKDYEEFSYNREELLLNLYDLNHEDATYFIVAWNKIYKSELFENIRYPVGKIHEDEATTYKIYDSCQKGVYVKIPMYGYFDAPSSITRDSFSLKRLQFFDAMNDRIAYFKGNEAILGFTIWARADSAIKYYKMLSGYVETETCKKKGEYDESLERKKELKGYVKDALNDSSLKKRLGLKTKIGYCIFLFCPKCYYKLQ